MALLALATACGGGGGGGGPIGPDVTPPGIPVSGKITVAPPIGSAVARLTGAAGAVEAAATVRLSNASAAQRGQPVVATTQAGADGAFLVDVAAQLGDRLEVTASDAAGNTSGVLSLQAGPQPTTLTVSEPGSNQLVTLVSGEGAFNLPFGGGNERYTLVVQSLNPGSGTFPVMVAGSAAAEVRGSLGGAAMAETPAGLEANIRAFEREVMAGLPRAPGARGLTLADDPAVGSTRTFNVVNRVDTAPNLTNRSHFDEVTARLRYKGQHTLIYVDTRAEGPHVSDALVTKVGDRFDGQTYGIDRAAFGPESDVDGNGRIIVLMTASVNALNTAQSVERGGVLTGFFYGIDLLFHPTFNPYANDAEIFYTLVPDPTKQFGAAAIQVAGFDDQLDGTLAHEFEHMINAGARLAPGASFETVWLDEGLAHYAETLNGVMFDGSPDLQNTLRAALWLQKPYAQSIVSGDDTLERRGAAWLLVAYLVDRHGQGLLRQLVQGPRTGVANIEQKANTSFPFLFFQFTAALYLDGQGISSDPAFDVPSLDVRQRFQEAKQWWTGTSRLPGSYLDVRNSTLPGTLNSSGVSLAGATPAYFDVSASASGNLPIIVSAARQSNLQVTIIRTR